MAQESIAHPVTQAYAAAVLARDIDAFMRLYAEDVRVFDAWGVWSYEGAAAWRSMVTEWFGSLGTERVRVSFADLSAVGDGEISTVSAFVTYAGVTESGEPLRAMQNRITWVIRGKGVEARILHEHTSAPIDFKNAQAILKRS